MVDHLNKLGLILRGLSITYNLDFMLVSLVSLREAEDFLRLELVF